MILVLSATTAMSVINIRKVSEVWGLDDASTGYDKEQQRMKTATVPLEARTANYHSAYEA